MGCLVCTFPDGRAEVVKLSPLIVVSMGEGSRVQCGPAGRISALSDIPWIGIVEDARGIKRCGHLCFREFVEGSYTDDSFCG